MGLSVDLISQFAKLANNTEESSKESTSYGTIKIMNGKTYVQLDGSDLLTPISSTTVVDEDDNEAVISSMTATAKEGDRVTVLIKNHTATVTGNLTDPSASNSSAENTNASVNSLSTQISDFDIVIANKVDTDIFIAQIARIDTIVSENATIKETLTATNGEIDTLKSSNVTITEQLTAHNASIDNLSSTKLDVTIANATYATIEELDGINATIYNLESTYADFSVATIGRLDALEATIDELDAESLDVRYANIDFSNIGSAAMEYFYSVSGLIDNVIVGDGTITGNLVGVTIAGDLIEGNTIKADKLVIKGDDGLYYKLNTDGMVTEAEQTDENSINGSVIRAKSITASKVDVSDLVAFDATIGGFNITETSLYSEVKDAEDNVTRGIYMDVDGQINFGDSNNFVKYYRDEDGTYKLAISAASILYALDGKQYSISDLGRIGDYVHIGTYENEPCIELGESDSDFRLIITNTRIMFMEGSDVPAYINNQSLNIKKAVIEEELQQGNFVWKIRSNGNMGLVWKGAT